MKLNQRTRILCILFSDLVGYSKLKDDRLKNKIVETMGTIFNRVASPDVQLIKTMGDGLMAVSYTPQPLAETALKLRDEFRNTDWRSQGFPDDFLIRIGLHLDEVTAHYGEDGAVLDVIGVGVDTAARIEPVTPPNAVCCSKQFFDFLQGRGAGKIRGVPTEQTALAKGYGAMELYELHWKHEVDTAPQISAAQPPVAPTIPMPNIKKPFTDKDRKEYLRAAFDGIHKYFDEAVKQLEATTPEVEASITTVSSTKLTCEIYVNGQLKTQAKIWLGSDTFSPIENIYFAQGRFDINNDNSYNDAVRVEDDGQTMYLKSTFGATYVRHGPDTTKPSTPAQIAESLWLRLTHVLEQ